MSNIVRDIPAQEGPLASQPIRTNFNHAQTEITALQARTNVPAPPNNTTTFLRGDNTWATPPAGTSGGVTNAVQGTANQISVTGGTTATATVALAAPSPVGSGTHGGAGQAITAMTVDGFGRVTHVTVGTTGGGGWNGTDALTNPITSEGATGTNLTLRRTQAPTTANQTLGIINLGAHSGTANVNGVVFTAQSAAAWSGSSQSSLLNLDTREGGVPRRVAQFNEQGGINVGSASGTAPQDGQINVTGIRINGNDITHALLQLAGLA